MGLGIQVKEKYSPKHHPDDQEFKKDDLKIIIDSSHNSLIFI
jgi:Fe-S cluster assembly iron-binding protein IscA